MPLPRSGEMDMKTRVRVLLWAIPMVLVASLALGTPTLQSAIDQLMAGETRQARDAASEILKAAPDDARRAQALKVLARTYWTDKDYEKALETLNRITTQYPRADEAAYAWWLKGYCHVRQGNPARALEAFAKVGSDYASSDKASDAAARCAFLACQETIGPLDERIARFKSALERYPKHPEFLELKRAYSQLLWAKSERMKTLEAKDQAVKAYRELADLSSADPEMKAFAEMNLVALTMEKERIKDQQRESGPQTETFSDALKACADYLKSHPNGPPDMTATVLLIQGESHYFNGQFESSNVAFDDLLARFGQDKNCQTQAAFAHYMKAMILYRQERPDEAHAEFTKVLDYPKEANFHGNCVQASALEWIGYRSLSSGDAPTAQEAKRLLDLEYPDRPEARRLSDYYRRNAIAVPQAAEGGK